MRGSSLWLLTTLSLSLPLALAAQNGDSKQVNDDEKLLKAASIKSDGPALLGFLKSRTLADADREKIGVLIAQLGAKSFKVREQATQALLDKGPVVLELLRQGLHHPDLEVQRRCELCIQKIKDADRFTDAMGAVVRLIGERKPDGAIAVLLAHLPFAANENVANDIRGVLTKLAIKDGKADKLIVAALADKEFTRRASAGEALVRAGAFDKHQKELRALLKDDNASVRWRVANAMLKIKEKDAVPALVDVLPSVTQNQGWEIEETLYRLAHGKPVPAVALGTDEATRIKCRDAWLTWWKEKAATIDMSVLANSQETLGFTTIALVDTGRVLELYPNGTVRWQIDTLEFPLDVQVLDGNRVLIAEYYGNRVTERNFKGEIVWEMPFEGIQMAQRLPNGNTFMGNRYELLEVDPTGKKVFNYHAPAQGIMKCMKLLGGDVICLLEEGRVARLNMAGKMISRFDIDFGTPLFGGRLHALENGNVLVPFHHKGKVVEYDQAGKVIWEVKVNEPIAATRLANGNTLVTSMNQSRAVEFDQAGKEVWEYRQNTRVTRAIRR